MKENEGIILPVLRGFISDPLNISLLQRLVLFMTLINGCRVIAISPLEYINDYNKIDNICTIPSVVFNQCMCVS